MTRFDPDPYGPYERSYNAEMLQGQIFGAFISVWEFRKRDVAMTNIEIARRTGGTRSQISKLMAHPQNWTLKTISELATAFDVDFKFALVDKAHHNRRFGASGMEYYSGVSHANWLSRPEVIENMQQLPTRQAMVTGSHLAQISHHGNQITTKDETPISVQSQTTPASPRVIL